MGRQELYRRGGIFSVTSQILVVDMLQSILPTELMTGIMILHAERSDLSLPRDGW
jgi:DNA excision repair protein ERCC-4